METHLLCVIYASRMNVRSPSTHANNLVFNQLYLYTHFECSNEFSRML